MYAMGALVVLFAAIMVTLDPHELWARVAWAAGGDAGPSDDPSPETAP
jgi:hypothetical protein